MSIRGIAFAGKKRSGKTTAAKFVAEKFGLEPLHVKSVLGEMVFPILRRLGVPIHEIQSYVFGDRIDEPIPGHPELTCRILLQATGNGFLSELPDPMLAQQLALADIPEHVLVVNESIRHAREVPWLRDNGFKVVRIIRPDADAVNTDTHASENDQSFPVDFEIINDGYVEDMLGKVEDYVGNFFRPKPEPVPRVVFVSGRPLAGKDTIVNHAVDYIQQRYGFEAMAYSSIDPVREFLADNGIDVSQKTPADRKLMAEIGTTLEQYNKFRSNGVLQVIKPVLQSSGVAFVFVREPWVLDTMKAIIAEFIPSVKMNTVWVSRRGCSIEPNNAADAVESADIDFDWMIDNRGTVEQLHATTLHFVDLLLNDIEGHLLVTA